MEKIKMFYQSEHIIVNVYDFFQDGTALIYNPALAGQNGGKGWLKVKYNKLIPLEYYNPNEKNGFMSPNEKNKYKHRLTLVSAVWKNSKNEYFNNLDDAISREKEIEKEEKEWLKRGEE